MILYFSGTGNSEYVAKRIGKITNDTVINLLDKIREKDYSDLYSDKPWVIVAPIYAWRIPRIVEEWMLWTKLCGNKAVYYVTTCGESCGDAAGYAKKLSEDKKMEFKGLTALVMPENYIAMFDAPNTEKALEIIDKQERRITTIGRYIKANREFPKVKIHGTHKIMSGIVNDLFYPLFVHSKKFYATEDCIACGKCELVCPLKNIHLVDGEPVWGNNCTHCMACICKCPREAIEYGKISAGKPRYTCPKDI